MILFNKYIKIQIRTGEELRFFSWKDFGVWVLNKTHFQSSLNFKIL